MRTPYRFEQYAKAGFVFVATTATYFFARATGVLPSWFNWEKDKAPLFSGDDKFAMVADHTKFSDVLMASQPTSLNLDDVAFLQSDFEAIDLEPMKEFALKVGQRQLLTTPEVAVVNPVPDQVIEVFKEYQYTLENIFLGDFIFLKVTEAGENVLPDWLEMRYKALSDLSSNLYTESITIRNDIAFILASSGFDIVNISSPDYPYLLSTYPMTSSSIYMIQPVAIAFENEVAFVVSYNPQGIEIINMSNLSNPQWISSCSLIIQPQDIAIQGHLAFIIAFDRYNPSNHSRLFVLNISDPLSSYIQNFYEIAGFQASQIILRSHYAFISGWAPTLQVIDISNPANISLISVYDLSGPDACTGFAIQKDTAFLNYPIGLQVLNISNLTNLAFLDLIKIFLLTRFRTT